MVDLAAIFTAEAEGCGMSKDVLREDLILVPVGGVRVHFCIRKRQSDLLQACLLRCQSTRNCEEDVRSRCFGAVKGGLTAERGGHSSNGMSRVGKSGALSDRGSRSGPSKKAERFVSS